MLISIVICSRDPQAASFVKRNLLCTARHPERLQLLLRDNRYDPKGICTVYNEAVREASGGLVVFMHEDVYMMEEGWDEVLRGIFARRPGLAVLGVAGSSWLSASPPLWAKAGPPWTFGKVVHELDEGRDYFLEIFNEKDGEQEVAALDGLWMAARREVCQACAFDETNFPGFHFYDIDFCMQAAAFGRVMATTDIRVKHLSAGSFDANWKAAAEAFRRKWNGELPRMRGGKALWPPPGSEKAKMLDLKGKAPQLTQV